MNDLYLQSVSLWPEPEIKTFDFEHLMLPHGLNTLISLWIQRDARWESVNPTWKAMPPSGYGNPGQSVLRLSKSMLRLMDGVGIGIVYKKSKKNIME